MADNVVSMNGAPILQPGEPVPAVVEWAEGLLERAKAGEIKGIACCVVFADDATGAAIRGQISYSLVGRLHAVSQEVIEYLEM